VLSFVESAFLIPYYSLVKKSTANHRKEHNAEMYIQWVTTLLLTIGYGSIFIRLASYCCLPNLRNPAKFSESSNLYSSGHPRSSILMSIESAHATSY